ncbi:MAG: hypothetical protein ACP5KN_13165, partial [Armatimonadota bacterium]
MRCAAIVAMVATLVLATCAAAQQNLLTNPGFEEIAAENTQMPAGWNPHGGDTEQLARHLVDDVHSG